MTPFDLLADDQINELQRLSAVSSISSGWMGSIVLLIRKPDVKPPPPNDSPVLSENFLCWKKHKDCCSESSDVRLGGGVGIARSDRT